jgi:hypothetical protein
VTTLVSKRTDDKGYVLLLAVGVLLAALSVVAALTLVAIRATTNSGKFRDRASAIGAAEGQVDLMVSKINAALTAAPTAPNWPCATTGGTISDSGPHPVSTTTTVTYYGANGANLGCPAPGTIVRSATVRSVATGPSLPNTLPVRRVMEAVLSFTGGDPVTVPVVALPRSMFSEKDVVFNNSVTVTQAPGVSTPSLYTNGSFSCNNNTALAGDLVAQGTVTAANSCTIGGNITAGGTVSTTAVQAGAGGNVLAVGNVSVTGGSSAVGGTIRSKGSIAWSGCPGARCTPNDASVVAPAVESMPSLPWNADVEAAWVAAGWTVVKFENPSDCTTVGGTNAPGNWLLTQSILAGPKTVVRTTCAVSIGNNVNVQLARDVAIVADGGVAFNTSLHLKANNQQSLYLIQPTNAVAPGCTTDGIAFNNNVTFETTVSLMAFTPCNISAAQSLNVTGQVYAGGRLTFNNSVGLTFRPMPMPIPSSSGTTVQPYGIQVTAKRENQ